MLSWTLFWLSADGNLRTDISYVTHPGHVLTVIKLELTHNQPVCVLQGAESELIKYLVSGISSYAKSINRHAFEGFCFRTQNTLVQKSIDSSFLIYKVHHNGRIRRVPSPDRVSGCHASCGFIPPWGYNWVGD